MSIIIVITIRNQILIIRNRIVIIRNRIVITRNGIVIIRTHITHKNNYLFKSAQLQVSAFGSKYRN